MSDKRAKAEKLLEEMLSPEMSAQLAKTDLSREFAGRIGEMAMSNVFEPLWTSDAFDRRTRSLVTLAMLIALHAGEEMAVHFPAAIRNGATITDLEELIYQASGYAGFPAAHSARNVAIRSLRAAGMID